MTSVDVSNQEQLEKYSFKNKPGCENYANCDGDYILDASKGFINDGPVYVNAKKGRFLAKLSQEGWCITALHYFDMIKTEQGMFGGFYSGGSKSPDQGSWKDYEVSRHGETHPSKKMDEATSWQEMPNCTVTFEAVANSGVVRTEADFQAIRRRCVALDCGGFAWMKPQYNQFGDEENPPICFFFRETPPALLKAIKSSNEFDLYIASDSYTQRNVTSPTVYERMPLEQA